jgi:hypothetical protein
MAFDNNQKDFDLPAGKDNGKRESSEFLPKYFRTPVNQKFLHSTLDQLISQGTLEKLNAYYGRKVTDAYNPSDLYVPEVSADRENYKFEPSVVQKDDLGNVNFYSDYIDFVNQIKNYNSSMVNHSVMNAQEYYAWSPRIDWDKFVNYREYFWMPYGASTVSITGQQRNVVSTYTVTKSDQGDNYAYIFTPDGVTANPTLNLYKGQTYKFDINAEGLPFVIRTQRILDDSYNVTDGIDVQGVENGVITFIVKDSAPEKLYYGSSNDINAWGLILINDIEENSAIDVLKEVAGKKNYTTADGVALSNGMKVNFKGTVTPESYAEGEYYVEGVGESIQLINAQELEVVSSFTNNVPVPFDSQNFDTVGFGTATSYAVNKDYIVINRASADRNPWSRHNRWVHRSVIENSAEANGEVPSIDQSTRARRPIIEFEPGIKLFNFGTTSKGNVDFIDTVTTDVMSDVEGSQGFYVDGVAVTNGVKILFTADQDPLVKNKIFEVKFIDFEDNGVTTRQISLVETANSNPVSGETVLVTNGVKNQGKLYYYDTSWNVGQEKINTNQTPLFDLFDADGNSFNDTILYPNSSFRGNKIFSYAVGSGTTDAELGFPLQYQNVENIGDIVFNFDLVTQSYVYQSQAVSGTLNSESAFLKKYNAQGQASVINGWTKAPTDSFQKINRLYVADDQTNDFAIDVYDKSGDLNDLKANVFVNNIKKIENVDWYILRLNSVAYVKFNQDLKKDDVLLIRTTSATDKNQNGHYEFPTNMQANPLNEKLSTFTVGQVTDHVKTITNELTEIQGVTPGISNLRDFPNASAYGRKFLQHSGPMVLSSFLLNNKSVNLITAISQNQNDYYKFKRSFVTAMDDLGFEGTPVQIVDKILQKLNIDNNSSLPYFKTDMLGIGAFISTTHQVLDVGNTFFALSKNHNLTTLSSQAVYVYLNGEQLLHGHDYIFSDGFVSVTKALTLDDTIIINEFETTNGCHIPATPTKLGLYPKYTPKKYLDTTAVEPLNVIQGHDGSVTVAFNDFRDDVILELEKRIYNNIKVEFDEDLFGIKTFLPRANTTNHFTFESINKTLLSDFNDWLTFIGNEDYTANSYQTDDNSLTWNYSNMVSPTGEKLLGFWRGIYKYAYDTDRPNIAPWEILGFTEEPSWWQTVYGPAPYTGDNLVLWQDLEKGIVREPNKKIIIKDKYKRPGLSNTIPVDGEGNIKSPFDSAYARGAVLQLTKQKYKFGDHAPIENAWRRSVHYPFALLKSYILHQPNKAIGIGLDVSRTKRNASGQIVYNSLTAIKPKDILFPNSINDKETQLTSGLINYIYEVVENSQTTNYDEYQSQFIGLETQIGFKVRGYSNKNNFKLLLDSKTPINSTTLFVPDENYELVYNVSTPIEILTYSGLIIEKLASGYSIKGYDKNDPYVRYHTVFEQNNDPVIRVGGVSASFVNWSENKRYDRGAYVKYANEFYAVNETHISDATFDSTKFVKLVELPTEGGATAVFRKKFITDSFVEVPYGTVYDSIQSIVDVILGYESYLKSKGFLFDQFDPQTLLVANWQLSAKEFLFWTTQNWNEGAVISLSPASKKLVVRTEYATTDNVVDNFYSHGVLKEDGNNLSKQNLRITRQSNLFELFTKNTINGIYFAKIPVVQKEHVCLIDNVTEFNDLIYDPASGYKQDRIKMLGYITEWDGSLNIPGFVFDEAKVTEWSPYTDYAMSDVVKHKEFYYTANSKLKGTQEFNDTDWRRLDGKPQSSLLSNFDYKTNQFADFYDLDTDNFDSQQQKLAQHLIGYQPREYLRNIINDDVSQYKFYQGFIREKGTANSLNKLFDALASADKESLNFYEEWAIRKGQYGAVDTFDEIEYRLDESKFRLNPQPIKLTDESSTNATDLVYRIQSGQTYLAPKNYQHTPFPVKYDRETYIKTAGPVNPIDISLTLSQYDGMLTDTNVVQLNVGDYVWIGNYNKTWTVFKYTDTTQSIVSVIKSGSTISVNTVDTAEMNAGEIFVVNADGKDYVLKCTSVNGTEIVCEDKEGFVTIDPAEGKIKRFITHRLASIDDINTVINDQGLQDNEKFWIDQSDDGKWKIVNNKFVFSTHNEVSSTSTSGDESFGTVIAANKQNSTLLVSQPTDGDGKIYVFIRGTESGLLRLSQVIEAPTSDPLFNLELFDSNSSFGQAVDISSDGNFVLIGAPTASNLQTEYKGIYNTTSNYNIGNIVQYKNQLWRATNQIEGAVANDLFSTVDASAFYKENIGFQTTNLLIGDSVFPNETTDHLLIRASADQYTATKIGDKLVLKYLDFSTEYPIDRNNYNKPVNQPFNGVGAPTIKNNVFSGAEISIQEKVDEILQIKLTLTDPQIGNLVSTDTAEGTIVYIRKVAAKTILYLKNVSGIFSASGNLLLDTLPIGDYTRVNTEDYDYLGGWWKVGIGAGVSTNAGADISANVVVQDIKLLNEIRDTNRFSSSLEQSINPITPQSPLVKAQFGVGSHYQQYHINPSNNSWEITGTNILSNKWFVRTSYDIAHDSGLNSSNSTNDMSVWFNNVDQNAFDFADLNIDSDDTNGVKEVVDVWEGYVDIDSQPDNNTNYYFPEAGVHRIYDTTTFVEADVTFVQFIGLEKIRVYFRNARNTVNPTGSKLFSLGSDAGASSTIQRLGGGVDRLLGSIEQSVQSGPTDGDILVFEYSSAITVSGDPAFYSVNDIEYWIWDEFENVQGIPQTANIPSSQNKDWIQTYNIPIGEGTASGFTNQGAFLVYKKDTSGQYAYNSAFTVPDTQSGLRLGSKIQLRDVDGTTVAFISAQGDGTTNLPGKIYFVKYNSTKNWWLGVDENYMGEFDDTADYLKDELVAFNNQIYKAKTNISANNWNSNLWDLQDTHADFLGYIPNDSGIELHGDSTLDQSRLIRFAQTFDVDTNGVNIVITNQYNNGTQDVTVYRLHGEHYTFKQTIIPPEDSAPTIDFGSDVSISGNGELIAVGSPLKDLSQVDMGVVYVYKKVNNDTGIYTLNQTLSSPDKETSEQFGNTLSFSGNVLAVTSLKGDQQVDDGSTVLDTRYDVGSVHLFEKFENTLLYAEKFSYDNSFDQFGTNLLVNNNHVYVGLPKLQLTDKQKGTVVDFRKAPNENNWNSIHESSEGIDQPDLSKIDGIFLYSKSQNKLLTRLDYVDPIFGKIPGPAEAELYYKTNYDPAVYNMDTAVGTIDKTNHWDKTQVGRLWWNISKAQYYYPYQSTIIFNNSYWNKLFVGASIDVHEWTESQYTPTQYNSISASAEGEALGITGTVDNPTDYVTRKVYDKVAGVLSNRYYFWVKGKTTTPEIESRSLSANAVAKLIENPRSQGYKYVTIFGKNKFAIVNCDQFIQDQDTIISFRLKSIETNNNVHKEYGLLTEGSAESTLPKDIESVWFNSLIGYDEQFNPIPDPNLSEKLKYGTLQAPRQSWFANKQEALKQTVERINSVLINNLIVDEVNIDTLTQSDPAPSINTGLFDLIVDTEKDLDFVGVGSVKPASINITVENGKLINAVVTDPGKGYRTIPTYKIKTSTGEGGVIGLSIDSNGSISSARILSQGKNYSNTATVEIRKFSALVSSDSTVDGKWAIYSYSITEGWLKSKIQAYNVNLYWDYADWYAEGYNQFTAIDHVISQSYEINGISDSIGQIIKINNIGAGGWLLLKKIDSQPDVDYTVNYETIGRQNGTIQFSDKLYVYSGNVGFDSNSFDIQLYDRQPIQETRVILETVRDRIFVEELAVEYNKLYFAGIHYALSENKLNDFVFKTSFVKAQHNVGELTQKITFKNDNLSNYEDYVQEVKPYKSKIREYVSSYQKTEPTNSVITDFDYPPRYINGNIEPSKVTVFNDELLGADNINSYPDKNWKDNIGYKITAINVADPGTEYKNPPAVEITGGGGSGATARAYIKNGAVSRINVINSGSGYISSPTVTLSGSTTGVQAKASAVLGESLPRTSHIGIKFDRNTGTTLITNLQRTETFTGNNSQLKFKLKWPMDLRTNTIEILVDGTKQLKSTFTYGNDNDTTKSYARQTGYIQFVLPPANLSAISITYKINEDVLNTADRFDLYQPTAGMPGKELAQVIDGIDYGGVEVRSIGFEDTSGWGNEPYMQGDWDNYDESYEDEVFYLDGSTLTLDLSKTLEAGVEYHVYQNGIRVDGPQGVMASIQGDGSTKTVDVSMLETDDGDVIIVRKSTSDGSFLPDPSAVDTLVKGGDLAYSTAQGINAEDINIDGDGFVTEISAKGPEEFVPGQVLDTLDIQVYDRGDNTGSKINSYNYVGDGSNTTFAFVDNPQSNTAIFLSVNNILKNNDTYTVDYQNKNIVFNQAPSSGDKINFITMGNNGESILDVDTFTGDGSTTEFVTRAKYTQGNVQTFVKVNGETQTYSVIETDSSYAVAERVAIRFNTAPSQNSVINIVVYESASQSFSEVTQNIYTGDGSTTQYQLNPTPFTQTPFTNNVIVKVDNDVLRSGFHKKFTVSTLREYEFKNWQVLPGTINTSDVRAYLNSVELNSAQYTWNPGNSSVTLTGGIGVVGDILDVYIENGEYSVSDSGVLSLSVAPAQGNQITAYQFSKHDIQEIDRTQYDVIAKLTITVNTEDYYQYNQLTNGVVQLNRPAVDAHYVWVCVNGEWLAPSIDYTVSNDQMYLKINRTLSQNDEIDVIHFTAPSFIGKFAYRQFKDVMNRTHFKRIGNDRQYFLAQNLNWYDKEIVLTDATGIAEPSVVSQLPGIIFIDGERIEYYQKDGNSLQQLRRGTFGTGIAEVHHVNTEVFDQSAFQNVPYQDQFISETYTGTDVVNDVLNIGFVPSNVNQFELFVGGKRLRKNAISVYDPTVGQDSPEADVTVPAEFSVDGTTARITFTETPAENAKIVLVRKQGRIWQSGSDPLSQTENDIARFIRQKEVAVPQ